MGVGFSYLERGKAMKYKTDCCDIFITAKSEEELDSALEKHYLGKRHLDAIEEERKEEEEEANYVRSYRKMRR